MYFLNYGLRKTWLDKRLKSPVGNTDSISAPASLPYSLISVKVIELEKVTLSDMKSLKTFC